MRRSLALLLPALICGCLPGRDNPRDPANAPNAVLKVVDETGDVVGPVSRGRDVTLDATASSDPQGAITCTFERITDAGDVPLAGCDGCRCALGDLRRQLAVDEPHLFRVEVRDPGGNVDVSDPVTVRLTNSPPTVFAGATRTVPKGGFPWALGQDFSVPFRAIANDPDGDPLLYQWSFPDELTVLHSATADDAAFTRILGTGATQYIATVTVEENVGLPSGPGRLQSFPSTTRVVVGPPNLWTAAIGEGEIERIDGGSGTLVPIGGIEPLTDLNAAVFVTPGTVDDRLLYYYTPPAASARLVSAPESDLLSQAVFANVAGTRSALATDTTRGRVWLHLDANNLGCGVTGPVLAALDPSTLAVMECVPLAGALDRQIEVDDDGIVYSWERLGAVVARYDLDASALDTDVRESASNDLLLGGGVRPAGPDGVAELWMIVMPGLFDNEIQPVRLEVIRDGAVAACVELDAELATDIAFVSRDEAWMEVPNEGLFRLDASVIDTLLAPPAPARDACPRVSLLAESAIDHVPGVFDVVELLADRVTGAAWGRSYGTGGIYRAQRGGDSRLFPVDAAPAIPRAIDPSGRIVFTSPIGISRGHAASSDGVVTSLPFFLGGYPEPDLTTGGFWAALLLPPALVQITEDGSVSRFETSVELQAPGGGSSQASPGLSRMLRLVPGRDTAYVMTSRLPDFRPGDLYRLDLSTSPPTSVLLFDTAGSLQIVNGGSIWEPSSPATADAPFVWTRMGAEVLALTTNGVPSNANTPFMLPVPEQSGPIRAAMSPHTNHLCLATVNGTNLVLRRLAPDGTVTLLNTSGLSFPGSSELVGVAAIPDVDPALPDEPDLCIVAYNLGAATAPPRIAAWQDPGPGAEMQWQPPTVDDPPQRSMSGYTLTSFAPESRDSIWVTVTAGDGSEKVHLKRVVNALEEDRFLRASGPNVFVYSSARSAPFAPPAP